MREFGLALLLLLAAFIVGCSGTVGVEGNPDFDWEGYGTYGWWPDQGFEEGEGEGFEGEGFEGEEGEEGEEGDEGDEGEDPPNLNDKQNDQRIRRAIDSELKNKGYANNPSGPSNLMITFHIANNNQINPEKFGYHWWKGAGDQENKVYPRGTLVIDVINPKDHQVVWRGIDRDAIKSPDEDQRQISQAVRRIMNKFPHHQ
jgi:hypothetical protein